MNEIKVFENSQFGEVRTIAEGDNYEFVKQWTDLVDVEVQVGDTCSVL